MPTADVDDAALGLATPAVAAEVAVHVGVCLRCRDRLAETRAAHDAVTAAVRETARRGYAHASETGTPDDARAIRCADVRAGPRVRCEGG